MAEIKQVSQITSLPGVKRDGTNLDGDNYVDAQWCRFVRQEGRPKKMGGYQEVGSAIPGPIRTLTVWTRGDFAGLITGSQSGITQANIDANGGSGTTYDRTPSGWTTQEGTWTMDTMYDAAVGSASTIIIAHRNNAITSIDEATNCQVYFGLASNTAAFQPITGLSVSGGICCIAPYLVYYGNDGLVGWTDINQPQTLTGGDAGTARVTGAKVVKALPYRAGSGAAAILWSLDSVIKMEYVGGNAIFRFSTLSAQSSIASQNSVIEYDGDYFWVGVDRFMVMSGGKVQELPNLMSKNFFFDNLNFDQRQKIWATKIPRFNEIIWFYPTGTNTECNRAVVFNVLTKTWYDFELSRSGGYNSQVFHYPVWGGDSSQKLVRITLSGVTGSFQEGDSVVGVNTNVPAIVSKVESSTSLLVKPAGAYREDFVVVGETLNNNSRSGSGATVTAVPIHSAYIHEKGLNAVTNDAETAIPSWFETSDFGYPTGGAQQNNIQGINRWTRLIRVEPDFVMNGNMTCEVIGREFAQQPNTASSPFTFGVETGKIDMREQRRQIHLRFESNEINGNYEMGRVILHTEPGDIRS